MNRKSLFLASLILLSGKMVAQNKITLGLEAGANYSDMRGKGLAEIYDYDFGFQSGFILEFPLGDRISLVSSLGYERKTTSYKFSDIPFRQNDPNDPILIFDAKISRIYNYLTVPLLVKYKFLQSQNFYIQSGLYTSYLMKTKDKIDGTLPISDPTFYTDTFDLGVLIRIGYGFSIGNKNRLNIQVGDNLGFLADKLNSFNLTAGWSIQLQ